MKTKFISLAISLIILLTTLFAPFGYLNYKTPLYIHDLLSNSLIITYGILFFHIVLSISIRMLSFDRIKLMFLFDSLLLIVFYGGVIIDSKVVLTEAKGFGWNYVDNSFGVNYVFFISLFLLISLDIYFSIKWIKNIENS